MMKARKKLRMKKDSQPAALLSKKQKKALQKIVATKEKKQSRAELEEELRRLRLPEITKTVASPCEIFSGTKRKKRNRTNGGPDPGPRKRRRDEEEQEQQQEEEEEEVAPPEPEAKKEEVSEQQEAPLKRKKKKKKKKKGGEEAKDSSAAPEEGEPRPVASPEAAAPPPTEDGAQAAAAEADDSTAAPREKKRFVVVQRPQEMQKAREALPILSEEAAIMEAVEAHDVVVLIGPTGCGKTTQVPQFLYEAGFTEGEPALKIGVTEPRRVAAIAMSSRVATELCLSHHQVSYQIRYEGNAGDRTKIKFMTDGVLLQEMKTDFLLGAYSAVVVDEAHERSIYTDLLIGLLALCVRSRRKKGLRPLKLIIMSATLDAVSFVENDKLFPDAKPPVIAVEGRQHPIVVHHLKRTPRDYLLQAFAKTCELHRKNSVQGGGILVFLTGAQEVNALVAWLRRAFPGRGKEAVAAAKKEEKEEEEEEGLAPIRVDDFSTLPADEEAELRGARRLPPPASESGQADADSDSDPGSDADFAAADPADLPVFRDAPGVHALPLYSLLPAARQAAVFRPPPPGRRLVVAATNVAETSLTIPGVRFVVDCGRAKEKRFDPASGAAAFHVRWVSRASADQRAGRAGRTAPGHCHRLYSSQVYRDMDEHPEPEMRRRPVEDVVLLLKSFSRVPILRFPFPSPPDATSVEAAQRSLLEIGALEETEGRVAATREGRCLARLPLPPRLAKLVWLAAGQQQRPALPLAILLASALAVPELLTLTSPSAAPAPFRRWLQKLDPGLLLGDLTWLLGGAWWFCWQLDSQGAAEAALRPKAEAVGLRWKGLQEVRKMRRQLTDSVNALVPGLDLAADAATREEPRPDLLLELRQMLVVAFPRHVARRAAVHPDLPAAEKKRLRGAYLTELEDGPVYLHPHSALHGGDHEWLLFLELHRSTSQRLLLRLLLVLDPRWLPLLLPRRVAVSGPLLDPPPRFDAGLDGLVCRAERVEFGARRWLLPADAWAPLPTDRRWDSLDADSGLRWFARRLMEGRVVPALRPLADKWMSTLSPALATQPWGAVRPQVKRLLSALVGITSARQLRDKWRQDPKFLWSVVSDWLPPHLRLSAEAKWPPVDAE